MTLSHDQASLRLVDFLYETLPDEEHAAVATHLASCPICAAEMSGWRQVRSTAGTALRGALDEAPPAGLHAAILAAAHAAEQEKRRAPALTAAKTSSSIKSGWWEHWRKAWVVPAFAMAAVFTLFVISRNTLFKTRFGEQAAQEQVKDWEGAASKAAPAAASAPTAAAEPPRPVPEASSDKVAKPSARAERHAAAPRRDIAKAEGAGPRGEAASSREKAAIDELSSSRPPSSGGEAKPATRTFAQPPPARSAVAAPAKAKKPVAAGNSYGDDDGTELDRASRAANTLDAEPSAGASAGFGSLGRGGLVAPTRAPAAAQAEPAPVVATPPPAEAARAAAPAAPPPPPRPAPKAAVSSEAKKKSAPKDEREAAIADLAEEETVSRAERKPTPGSLQERLRSAERAFAARDWATAGRAFRELVRLYPSDARVEDWKNKALTAERASVSR